MTYNGIKNAKCCLFCKKYSDIITELRIAGVNPGVIDNYYCYEHDEYTSPVSVCSFFEESRKEG